MIKYTSKTLSNTIRLAAIREDSSLSVVTTASNASVALAHDRMHLMFGSGESGIWLDPSFALLASHNHIELVPSPERQPPPTNSYWLLLDFLRKPSQPDLLEQ